MTLLLVLNVFQATSWYCMLSNLHMDAYILTSDHSALGLGVAIIAMIQSSVQVFKFYRHHISPALLSILNATVMLLWIVVIVIGWNPTSYSYDELTGISTPDVMGWLYAYSEYWYSESLYTGVGVTLALAMGFAVMSIVSL